MRRRERFLLLSSASVYLVLRALAFERGVQRWSDTSSYLSQASVPLRSRDFFAGTRGFTVPLLWRLLPQSATVWTWTQLALSSVSWLFAAYAVWWVMDHRPARWFGGWLVLALGLTNEVTQWDGDLLSESVAISLTAALTGLVLLAVRDPTRRKLVAAGVVAFMWAFTRDSNAYAAVAVVPILLVTLAFRPRSRLAAAALAGTIAIAVASVAAAEAGGRATAPARDAINFRVARDPDGAEWLRANGYRGLYARNTPAIYRSYLLNHPVPTVAAPLKRGRISLPASSDDRLTALWTPSVASYDTGRPVLRMPRPIQQLFFPPNVNLLLFEALLILAAATLFGATRTSAVPLAMLAGAYAQLVVVWSGSGQESTVTHSSLP